MQEEGADMSPESPNNLEKEALERQPKTLKETLSNLKETFTEAVKDPVLNTALDSWWGAASPKFYTDPNQPAPEHFSEGIEEISARILSQYGSLPEERQEQIESGWSKLREEFTDRSLPEDEVKKQVEMAMLAVSHLASGGRDFMGAEEDTSGQRDTGQEDIQPQSESAGPYQQQETGIPNQLQDALNRIMSGDPTRRRGEFRGGMPEFDPETEMVLYIRANVPGGEIPVVVKKRIEDNLSSMHQKLADAEKRLESFGAEVNAGSINEIALWIRAFRENGERLKNTQYVDWAETMQREFEARSSLHEYFLIYDKAIQPDELLNNSKAIKGRFLNVYFRKPEVVEAFIYYEQNAEKYLRSRGDRKVAFRQEVAQYLGNQFNDNPENLQWAQNMAERLWRISGRAALHDRLEPRNPNEPEKEQEFIGEALNGDLIMRRTVNLINTIKTQETFIHPWLPLLDNVDIGNKDFITALFGSIESVEKSQHLSGLRERGGAHTVTTAEVTATYNENEQWWANNMQDVIGASKTVHDKEKPDDITKNKFIDLSNEEFKNKDGSLDTAAFAQRQISPAQLRILLNYDFSKLGDNVYNGFIFSNIANPDKIRNLMIGTPKDFLRNPSRDNWKALVDNLTYTGRNQDKIKVQLMTNLGIYMTSQRKKHLGVPNAKYSEFEALVNNIVSEEGGYLRAADSKKIKKDVLKNDFLYYYREVRQAFDLLSFLLTLLGQIVSSGVKAK